MMLKKNLDNHEAKIILIEDSDVDAKFLCAQIHKTNSDLDLIRLSDGEMALEYFDTQGNEEACHNLVILDLSLPKVTGLEVLSFLKEKNHHILKHLIVLTGSENPNDRDESLASGIYSYNTKPWDIDGYVDFVRGPLSSALLSLSNCCLPSKKNKE